MKNYELGVAADTFGPRFVYMLDTLCTFYGWKWSKNLQNAQLHLCYERLPSLKSAVHIVPSGLLEIEETKIVGDWGDYKQVPSPQGSDPLAGAFYLLTCMEEYVCPDRDAHGRVPSSSLDVVKRGHHRVPLADRLMAALASELTRKANLPPPTPIREHGLSTLDLDAPYLLHHQPARKHINALGRAILNGDLKDSFTIAQSIVTNREDPFDTMGYLQRVHEERELKPTLFVLMGYGNRFDPSGLSDGEFWQRYLLALTWVDLTLHPSYFTVNDLTLLKEEKSRLENLVGFRISKSRQHFLRIEWPQTLRNLIAVGINEDHSLMWPDSLGFRCGTARIINWFDLECNQATSLRLVPPCFMDVTARLYEGLSPDEAVVEAQQLAKECRVSGSGLRVIWHNSNLGPLYGWAPWRAAYEQILDLI